MFRLRDEAELERRYVEHLDHAGVGRLARQLGDLSEKHGGRRLVLLCFEANVADCHRGQFARWWQQQTGQEVPELRQSCDQSRKRPDAQGRLFE